MCLIIRFEAVQRLARVVSRSFVEQGVEQEGERESSDTCPGEDDASGEAASLGKPFWQQLDDWHVQDSAANADADALKQDKLPYLWNSL